MIQTTHDLPAASAALDAAIATPKRGDLGASLSELEPRIKAALKAKMTPTSIAKILKANGVNASVDGLRRYVKAVADGTKRPRKPSVKSSQNGKANRPLAQTTVVESPAKIPSGDGFFHAEDVDN